MGRNWGRNASERAQWLIIIVGAIVLLFLAFHMAWGGQEEKPRDRPMVSVSDDDPRFNCHTMGNKLCGN